MADIKHYLIIRAPMETVYRAVTEQAGLAGWWTEETIAEPVVGSISEFKFGDRYHNRMKITHLVPDRRVEWVCLEGDKEWVGTTFSFDLQRDGDNTVVRFGHNEWREVTDFFASCNFNWGCYMISLTKYCETGQGEPFKRQS